MTLLIICIWLFAGILLSVEQFPLIQLLPTGLRIALHLYFVFLGPFLLYREKITVVQIVQSCLSCMVMILLVFNEDWLAFVLIGIPLLLYNLWLFRDNLRLQNV